MSNKDNRNPAKPSSPREGIKNNQRTPDKDFNPSKPMPEKSKK